MREDVENGSGCRREHRLTLAHVGVLRRPLAKVNAVLIGPVPIVGRGFHVCPHASGIWKKGRGPDARAGEAHIAKNPISAIVTAVRRVVVSSAIGDCMSCPLARRCRRLRPADRQAKVAATPSPAEGTQAGYWYQRSEMAGRTERAGRWRLRPSCRTPSRHHEFRLVPIRFREDGRPARTGLDLMRQNLRRSHPGAGDEEIERSLTYCLTSGAPIQTKNHSRFSTRMSATVPLPRTRTPDFLVPNRRPLHRMVPAFLSMSSRSSSVEGCCIVAPDPCLVASFALKRNTECI